ncbi:unnamed protein product [Allacma fusca]|uniref:Transmembrane protein 230 n=1 Tax=Allacma fusca TaxID=39272 RepID=A0A8J2L5F8_9HEXA|nr:unnamed protein product [Allacma fusca]
MTKIRVISRKTAAVNSSQPGNRTAATNGNQFNVYDYLPLMKNFNGNPDDYIDSQFQKPPVNIPKRSIALAIFLCCTGTLLIGLGLLYLTGYLSERFADRVWPMMIMGCLLFTPGFYHVRIAYYAYKGVPGYSFEDIPEFE